MVVLHHNFITHHIKYIVSVFDPLPNDMKFVLRSNMFNEMCIKKCIILAMCVGNVHWSGNMQHKCQMENPRHKVVLGNVTYYISAHHFDVHSVKLLKFYCV